MSKLRKNARMFFKGSFRQRSYVKNRLSMLGNFTAAVFKMLFGVFTNSIFFFISAFYSMGIGYAKQTYIRGFAKGKGYKYVNRYYLKMAQILIASSAIYVLYMVRLLFIDDLFVYNKLAAIGLSLIAFSDLYFSIYGFVKSKKLSDLLLEGLKGVYLASSFPAIVLAQVAILSFQEQKPYYNTLNAVSGIAFGTLSAIIGILMLLKYYRTRNQYTPTDNNFETFESTFDTDEMQIQEEKTNE